MTEAELTVLSNYMYEVVPATFQMFISGITVFVMVISAIFVAGFFSYLVRVVFSMVSFRPKQRTDM